MNRRKNQHPKSQWGKKMMCEEKATYITEREAKKVAHGIALARGNRRQRAYRCPICNHFHLTSQKGGA